MAYSTNWKQVNPRLGMPTITSTDTSALLPLGTRCMAEDFGANQNGVAEFIYLKGVASTTVGSWVTFSQDDHSTALLAANAIGPVAIAMSANVANQYGWYQIYGKAVGLALTGFVDNANVYATATAGSVDDAVVSGDRVKNAKGASALDGPATGMAEFEIAYPVMDDGLAA
jgi:hypothetical protein